MAFLPFAAIEPDLPDMLMKNVFYGLKAPYDYLSGAKKRMEDPDNLPRAAWSAEQKESTFEQRKPKQSKEQQETPPSQKASEGFWVCLTKPDGAELSDEEIRLFTDPEVRKISWIEASLQENGRGKPKFAEIDVLAHDPDAGRLHLAELPPAGKILTLRPNTYQLRKQLDVIAALQNIPNPAHRPLLRLLQPEQFANWPSMWREPEPDWMVLTDPDRSGASEQRDFVRRALATPDFALLEGPPGSGKTTVICELIAQMARRGKRVLLCASTHVAVDNVLERLMAESNAHRDLVIPLRIGRDESLSDEAKKWTLERLTMRERKRVLDYLRKVSAPDAAQIRLQDDLRSAQGDHIVERMLLEGSNLVCGSTIGILQHPDIKKGDQATPSFDMLIVDEASKTTFQEFLVPALLAKRWVLVGDPKQLSPFVDDDGVAAALDDCLPDEDRRNACIDTFLAMTGKRGAAAVVANAKQEEIWREEAAHRGVAIRAPADPDAALADIVTGSEASLDARPQALRIDIETIRAADDALPVLRRRHAANGAKEPPVWGQELAWRQVTLYSLRGETGGNADGLRRDAANLLPASADEKLKNAIALIRRVALPSVIEILRHGFERSGDRDRGNALTDGIPKKVLKDRHVLLSWQHRMHPEIADFPARDFYEGQALRSGDAMSSRPWGWREDEPRMTWRDVRGRFVAREGGNRAEVDEALRELRAFAAWSKTNPPPGSRDWEIALLSPYRIQERALRKAVQKLAGGASGSRRLRLSAHCIADICTVDRFQGQEADMVLLSLGNTRGTHFLRAPNRLNVALTRARHRLVILGHRAGMKGAGGALGRLAEAAPWGRSVAQGEKE
ncbi:AAA domain-containing protein [Rhodovulum sulfidophilum]|uniref:AAA domain-containing protein n=1 Tax=Rhodovulum sulfidophilum TaxID=35806 RepID=UPI001F1D61B4|nr:AAA domain-containing protein [Rhodovulum sulfidophilum]MCE8439455.1 AAA domain-containing protein [Rhodovulum sulfidophilum]MCE8467514.1 AAA domain-containing protein [Rhodovulum sulfidophilum]